jgi:hypothetical protein
MRERLPLAAYTSTAGLYSVVVIDCDGEGVRSVVEPKVRIAFYLHSLVYRCHAREYDAVRRSVLHYVIQFDQIPADIEGIAGRAR